MIFLRGARQLVTLRGPAPPRRGMQLADLGIIQDGALLIDGEEIREVGPTRRIENLSQTRSASVLDATGKVVLPGFVDSHTRLVLASLPLREPLLEAISGPRSRLVSAPGFPSLLRSGPPKELRHRAQAWSNLFAAHGTTSLEIRSGMGLEVDSEIKALRAARALDEKPLDVSRSFWAGPIEAGRRGYTPSELEQVVKVLLPIIRRRRLASFCDVDCRPGAFDRGQARRILDAARALGFGTRVEGDRREHFGAARLAVEAGARTAGQLELIGDEDIALLAASDTIATLLPAAVAAHVADRYPPARTLLDRGAAVALATGFAPDCPTLSMPAVLSLACREMSLSPEEAITAATVNGAAAIGRAERLGSLEPGKQADLAMFDVRDYREIPYYFGFNLCVMTMKKGRVICQAPAAAR